MSIPLSTIKEVLRDIVINATGYPESKVIIANQNAPKPAKPYITINPVLSITKPFLEDMDIDNETDTTIYPVRDILTSIHGFGNGSLSALSNVMTYLDRFQGVELLRSNNLGLLNRATLNIKDLSSDIDDNLFVGHSQMDLKLQCQESDIIDDTYPGASEVQIDIDVSFDGPNTNTNPAIITLNETITGNTESSYDGLNPPVNFTITDITYNSFVLDFEEG